MLYTDYQKAELPWVATIPSHWQQIRNGGIFDYHQDKVGENYASFQLLSLTTSGIKSKDIHDATGKVPASYEGYQVVKPGDMVFCLFDLDCSAVFSGLSVHYGMITSAYEVMTPKAKIVNPRYLDYWFRSVFQGRYYKIFSKSVRYTINYDIFKALKTPVPPKDEQDQIVRYLDWKISDINKLIHGYQREIKLLEERKMTIVNRIVQNGINPNAKTKESGIEYIGRIPEHWTVLLNHRIFKSMSRKFNGNETVLSLSQKDGLIPYEEMTERSLHTASYDNWQLVLPNDLVLNRFKAHLGVFFASRYRGIVTFHYGVYEPKMPMITKFYETLYHTPVYRRVYAGQSKGMTVGLQNLSDTDFYAVYTVYLPIDEQIEIVKKIEKRETEYLEAKHKIDKQIELLNEYRTRLIFDVVTGQMDVRGIEIPDYVPEEDIAEENPAEDGSADEEVDMNAD